MTFKIENSMSTYELEESGNFIKIISDTENKKVMVKIFSKKQRNALKVFLSYIKSIFIRKTKSPDVDLSLDKEDARKVSYFLINHLQNVSDSNRPVC